MEYIVTYAFSFTQKRKLTCAYDSERAHSPIVSQFCFRLVIPPLVLRLAKEMTDGFNESQFVT